MSRTVYVNGAYVPEEDAKISVFDRGFLFADGVYEVTSVLGGKLIDFDGHAARLERSLCSNRRRDVARQAPRRTAICVHRDNRSRSCATAMP